MRWLRRFGRPILCTGFMARPTGSTFETILPVAKEQRVGAFCWGLDFLRRITGRARMAA